MVDMQNYDLDDIDELVIRSKRKNNGLDPTGQYDISYYENYIKENVIILSEFIKDILNSISFIQDEKTKQRLMRWVNHDLTPLYEKTTNKNVREEEKKYPNSNIGYFETHKYAMFIEKDMINYVSNYDKLINFMNNVFTNVKISRKKGLPDSNILYEIFVKSKHACSNLGIRSADSESLYESITSPYEEHSRFCEVDVEIDEENSLEQDVSISSLPYSVSVPDFTVNGASKFERQIVDMPKVYYNKSYFQKPPVR
ncbi:MAG TPA: hypothetical protein DHV70_03895 [Firmicutes bacterium]|nr:hypothetical protein [Bacillota bacterium]